MSTAMHVAQGESLDLDDILASDMWLRLWVSGPNSNNPSKPDVEADYTEPTGSGYAAKTLTGGGANWTKSGSNPTIATYNVVQVFTTSAPGTLGPILGYTLHRKSDNKLRHVFKFDNPWSAVQIGDHLDLTVKVTQK